MTFDPSPPSPTCPRCGAELHPLANLVKLARQTSGRAADALQALETRRLALPSIVGVALSEAHLDCRLLAERLSCHARTCAPRSTSSAPPPPRASTSTDERHP